MPEICHFYGIVITMYLPDHNPPHFHVRYNEYRATIDIQTGEVTGQMPRRALHLVFDWLDLHKEELMQKIRMNGTLLDMFQKVAQIAMQLAQQTDPAMAQQIAMITQGIMGQAGMQAPAGSSGGELPQGIPEVDNMEKQPEMKTENKLVERAKERSANASRPN